MPCLHDGFCKPTILTTFTLVWLSENLRLIFFIHSFVGRMSKQSNRYWLETEHFSITNKSRILSEVPYHDCKSQTRLSRFELFPESKLFCTKLTPLHTQCPDIFFTYEKGFNMHTGKRNPFQLPEDEQYNKLSIQIVSGKLFMPKLNCMFLL